MPDCLPSARLNELTLLKNVPVSVTIELTRRCPLSCVHCYLPETCGRARPPRELSAQQWGRILAQLARAGGLYLVFTGGEPLLRPDLPELCRRAKSLNFDVRVFSSGLGMTAALAEEFGAAGVSAFEISFYGPRAAHDRVTGRRGSYEAALAAGRLLRSAGVGVKMKVPLTRDNFGYARRLRGLAEREGFLIGFDQVIAPANDGDRSALRLRLSTGQMRRAAALFSGEPGPALSSSSPADPAAPYSPAAAFICGAGRNVCAADPSGNLYPCLQLPVKLGNLMQRGFAGLWRSSPWLKRWRGLSVKDLKGCAGCRDASWCSFCPGISLIEEGDALLPNRPACAMAASMRKKSGVSKVKKSRP